MICLFICNVTVSQSYYSLKTFVCTNAFIGNNIVRVTGQLYISNDIELFRCR